jgi:hypothetical protein
MNIPSLVSRELHCLTVSVSGLLFNGLLLSGLLLRSMSSAGSARQAG